MGIFDTTDDLNKIAIYLDLIESDSQKLNRIIGQSLISANEALRHALRASSKDLYKHYLDRAIDKYIDAISIEKHDKLFMAYFGLAFCNGLVNDFKNQQANIKKAIEIYLELRQDQFYAKGDYYNDFWEDFDMEDEEDRKFKIKLANICTLGGAWLSHKIWEIPNSIKRNTINNMVSNVEPFVAKIKESFPELTEDL